ncbi:AraC family transcriptional regulator [Candidatus Odyssella thessalonicensis]|uniref:AraC family transcriptional regulator n=1 Tax=Candidatus Odyssella thessalonicensis TaxID=84647 RepID=UPI000225B43E|nr:AraC family transcriptional regulator [Candidatus Odyssella thessalonicensis]
MSYDHRINRIIEFIGKNLDADFTLNQLSEIACFSKYHFHRLFTAYTGLSLHQYIRWLRLKRAAHQLVVETDKSIISIALNAGFETHESFARAFRQMCGENPSEFRVKANWRTWETPPYSLPITREEIMKIIIKEFPMRRLAVIEHRGDPQRVGESVNKLITWAKSQPIDLRPRPGQAFGFAYDDPEVVPAEEFRFDLALTVPENFKMDDQVIEKELPAGRYAIAIHKGSRKNISDTIYGLYRGWLPGSGEELGDLPCIFCYYNFDHEVAETELVTEVWVLLK